MAGVTEGPFGSKLMTYADFAASGRLLPQFEAYLQQHVLPYYGNTHSEVSECGLRMSYLYSQARSIVTTELSADPEHYSVIFTGSGATAALDRLARILFQHTLQARTYEHNSEHKVTVHNNAAHNAVLHGSGDGSVQNLTVINNVPEDGPNFEAMPQSTLLQPPILQLPVLQLRPLKPPMLQPPTLQPTLPLQAPMLQPPMLQPPMLQPPMLQPPILQPPMLQPPMLQPPMLQPPMLRPPMLQHPMLQPPVLQQTMPLLQCGDGCCQMGQYGGQQQQSDPQVSSDPSLPVVFIGPHEHHSNEVLWRERRCKLVVIPEDSNGYVCLTTLEWQLQRHAAFRLKVGSFSAGSNVTGITQDVDAISELLHLYDALACFDYAGAGSHVPISMTAPPGRPLAYKDAVVLSPHKFLGGPAACGLLVARKRLFGDTPTVPGGGTVLFVSPTTHRYVTNIEQREEAGTPPILGAIRCGLAFTLRRALTAPLIHQLESAAAQALIAALSTHPNIVLLGSHLPAYHAPNRMAIVSLLVLVPWAAMPHAIQEGKYMQDGKYGKYRHRLLHHNFVGKLLNDMYGIQARSGCSCAGPYGHQLLGISPEQSRLHQDIVLQGLCSIKGGWTRVSLCFSHEPHQVQYIAAALHDIAEHGWKLLPEYVMDVATGGWKHRSQLGGSVSKRYKACNLEIVLQDSDTKSRKKLHESGRNDLLEGASQFQQGASKVQQWACKLLQAPAKLHKCVVRLAEESQASVPWHAQKTTHQAHLHADGPVKKLHKWFTSQGKPHQLPQERHSAQTTVANNIQLDTHNTVQELHRLNNRSQAKQHRVKQTTQHTAAIQHKASSHDIHVGARGAQDSNAQAAMLQFQQLHLSASRMLEQHLWQPGEKAVCSMGLEWGWMSPKKLGKVYSKQLKAARELYEAVGQHWAGVNVETVKEEFAIELPHSSSPNYVVPGAESSHLQQVFEEQRWWVMPYEAMLKLAGLDMGME